MDISNRFSLEDFLAYFFPGFTGTLGIYVALLLTPMQSYLTNLPTDIITGILLLFLCYIVGVLLSCFAEPLVKLYSKLSRKKREKSIIQLTGYENEIKAAYKQLLDIPEKKKLAWTESCFYLCRSLVIEYMPNFIPIIQRQSGLRQLRMNILPSLIIWFFTGILWGLQMMNNNQTSWGFLLIIVSVVLFLLMAYFIIDRMYSNERRETREVLSAFLAGYRTSKISIGNKGNM